MDGSEEAVIKGQYCLIDASYGNLAGTRLEVTNSGSDEIVILDQCVDLVLAAMMRTSLPRKPAYLIAIPNRVQSASW